MSKLLPPIVVNGVRYRVLRLEGGGLRFLLRGDDGRLSGVYGRNAQSTLSAAPLERKVGATLLELQSRAMRSLTCRDQCRDG